MLTFFCFALCLSKKTHQPEFKQKILDFQERTNKHKKTPGNMPPHFFCKLTSNSQENGDLAQNPCKLRPILAFRAAYPKRQSRFPVQLGLLE
jgi:hypothetical protein